MRKLDICELEREASRFRSRKAIDSIKKLLNGEWRPAKVLTLTGLPCTGKKTLLRQAAALAGAEKAVYIVAEAGDDIKDICAALNKERKQGKKYAFIEGTDKAEGFAKRSAILADYYSVVMRVAVTCDNETIMKLAKSGELFDRTIPMPLSYISFDEASIVSHIDINDYLVSGGAFMPNPDTETAQAYLDNYIASPILDIFHHNIARLYSSLYNDSHSRDLDIIADRVTALAEEYGLSDKLRDRNYLCNKAAKYLISINTAVDVEHNEIRIAEDGKDKTTETYNEIILAAPWLKYQLYKGSCEEKELRRILLRDTLITDTVMAFKEINEAYYIQKHYPKYTFETCRIAKGSKSKSYDLLIHDNEKRFLYILTCHSEAGEAESGLSPEPFLMVRSIQTDGMPIDYNYLLMDEGGIKTIKLTDYLHDIWKEREIRI